MTASVLKPGSRFAVMADPLSFESVVEQVSGSLRSVSGRKEISRAAMLDMCILIACVVLYILTAETLGFVLSSAAILLVLFGRMRVKSTIAIPATVLLAGLVYQLFAIGLRVPLPRGFLGW